MSDEKRSYLGFIQTTIERMANNSASIKGWSIGIVAAIIGIGIISNNDMDCMASLILFACACIITIVLWSLDAFYLYQEKLYRELYKHVRLTNKEEDIDYSMDARLVTVKQFNQGKAPCYMKVLVNRVIWPFYAPQILVYFLFIVLPMIVDCVEA